MTAQSHPESPETTAALGWGHRYLMCEPVGFTVSYAINPWMDPAQPPDLARARAQWSHLVDTLRGLGVEVATTVAAQGTPDMVFAMNSGFVDGGVVVPSRFRYEERRPEQPIWESWFREHGFEVRDLLAGTDERFEAGDVFPVHDYLVGGYGFRSTEGGLRLLADGLGVPMAELRLVDPRFYHLDTCFCPVDSRSALIYPDAFDEDGQDALRHLLPDSIWLSEDEALTFCANSLVVGRTLVMPACPPRVEEALRERGYQVLVEDLTEFHKSGGSIRCLTSPLDVDLAGMRERVRATDPFGEIVGSGDLR